MKKCVSIMLALVMALSLCACSSSGSGTSEKPSESQPADNQPSESQNAESSPAGAEDGSADADSDTAYVKSKGKLVVGITEFEPMDYTDENGEWIGFDADMAKAFAESLGVEAEFQIIDWDNKTLELEGKTIDVVWNGMTLNAEVKAAMECSNPYFDNAQVVIVPIAAAENYQTVESVKDLAFAVEVGSAAKEQADANGFKYTEVADQATALLEVSSGTADAAIIDYLMAKTMTGEDTSYEDLTFTASLNSEQYGVGFRKGSDLCTALNDFFKQSYADGTMQKIADSYNIGDKLVEQK